MKCLVTAFNNGVSLRVARSNKFTGKPVFFAYHRLKRTLSDKRRMSFNVAMHYPVITVYYAAISKH